MVDVVYRLTGFDDRLKTYEASEISVTHHLAFDVNNTSGSTGYTGSSGYRGHGYCNNRGRGSYYSIG